jgi:Fungal specific transcription factor domain
MRRWQPVPRSAVQEEEIPARGRRSPQQFLFLSGIKPSYSADARAHVLQRHIKDRKARTQTKQIRMAHDSVAAPKPSRSRLPGTQIGRRGPCFGIPAQSSSPRDVSLAKNLEDEDTERAQDLQTVVLGAGRLDPFAVYVVRTTAQEDSLIDFYANDILGLFKKKQSQFHPPRNICFKVNVTGEAAMAAMLYYAIRHIKARGGNVSMTDMFTYRARAIKSLNVAISRPELRFQDNTIMALLGYVCTLHEMLSTSQNLQRVNEESELDVHIQGLAQLIQAAGGFRLVQTRQRVGWVLQAVDIMSSGAISAGAFPVSLHAFHPSSSLEMDWDDFHPLIPAPDDLVPVMEEFVGVYGALLFLAKSHWECSVSDRADTYLFFQHGSVLYCHIQDNDDRSPFSSTQIALYLNLTLLSYSDMPPSALRQELLRLQDLMVDEDLDRNVSRYILMLMMVGNNKAGDVDSPARVNLLCRLSRVFKSLSSALQLQFWGCLIWFLTGDISDQRGRLLEPHELRQRVMVDLKLL